jgi:hypothetical protein
LPRDHLGIVRDTLVDDQPVAALLALLALRVVLLARLGLGLEAQDLVLALGADPSPVQQHAASVEIDR